MTVVGSLEGIYPYGTNYLVLLESIIENLHYDVRNYNANEVTYLNETNRTIITNLIDEKAERDRIVPYSIIMKAYGSESTEQTCVACREAVSKFLMEVGNAQPPLVISSQQLSLMYKSFKYLFNIVNKNDENNSKIRNWIENIVNDFASFYKKGAISG